MWKIIACLFLSFPIALFLPLQVVSSWPSIPDAEAAPAAESVTPGLRCVSFGPYVDNTVPPAQVPRSTIDTLMPIVTGQLGANCVFNYTFTNGNEYVIDWAADHGVAVVGALYLELASTPNYQALNDAQINTAIRYATDAKTGPALKALSCGSEFIMRGKWKNVDSTPIIVDCINRLKAAGVTQPIGSIDAYSIYCNQTYPCQPYSNAALMNAIDWVGVNVYPWWDGVWGGYCAPLSDVPQYHKNVVDSLVGIYPNKRVTLVEWGWPAGPEGTKACGNTTAGQANQQQVVNGTLAALRGHPAGQGFLFAAFREQYKSGPEGEGPVGQYWGVCAGTPPFSCPFSLQWAASIGGASSTAGTGW